MKRWARTSEKIIVRVGALLIGVVGVVSSSPAFGQEWLRNRRNSEGPGIRLGDSLVFHPGLGIEGGYDTNFFYSDENEPGAGRLRISVNLDLATRPPQRREDGDGQEGRGNVEFRFGVGAAYYEYFSDLELITDNRNVEVDANLNLHVLPSRPFSFILADNFSRGIQPQTEVGPRNFNRDENDARLTLIYSPGGGMFELRGGYAFRFRFFEEDGFGGNLQYLGNYTSHEVFVNFRWRFLPKTALTFSGSFIPILHSDDGGTGTRTSNDSYNVRSTVGLSGLLTRRFSLLLNVGYGAGFYTGEGVDYESVVGMVGLRFHISPTARISLHYNRDFYDGIFSDNYSKDRVEAIYSHLIAGRVLLSLTVGFSFVDYSSVTYQAGGEIFGPIERSDPIVDAKLFAEYRIRDWIAINATLEYTGNFTDTILPTLDLDDPVEFQRFVAMAGVRVMY